MTLPHSNDEKLLVDFGLVDTLHPILKDICWAVRRRVLSGLFIKDPEKPNIYSVDFFLLRDSL